MKPIKMFGLAALAALLAMAFVGATSAMASESTLLCKADENPCSKANVVTSVHETTVAGSPAELLSSAGTVKCDVLFSSTTVSTTHATTAEPIEGNFTYSNCKRNGTESCTVEEKNGPVEITVLKEGHETGAVTGKGEVNVHCGSFINCTYNGTGLAGTAKGPLLSSKTNGSVELSEQTTNHVGGLFCPATAKLDITTTPLEKTYITTDLGYCVETEHTKGLYTDEECETLGVPAGHSFTYELVLGPVGYAAGEELCYRVLGLHGLWKTFNVFGECTNDDARVPPESKYENSIITEVE